MFIRFCTTENETTIFDGFSEIGINIYTRYVPRKKYKNFWIDFLKSISLSTVVLGLPFLINLLRDAIIT